jgi:glycine betaine/proline transport system substrate-binding protein
MRSRFRLLLGLLLALSLVAAACGDDDDDTAAGGDDGTEEPAADDGAASDDAAGGGSEPSGDKPTITLVKNAWTASALNVEIAKQIIESELGNPVEIVAIDENLQFEGLASGELDASLELWPSGVSEDEQKYLDDGSVVNIGELGAVGRIGWFVPDYVVEANPALATWEGFLDPAVAAEFASAETGDNGRFLGTDPSYSQADEAIVANLELPFQVVYSGSEAATIAELDSKVAAGEPILMYWWTPTAAAAKYNLQKVELPAYSDDCYADPAGIACDYPEDVLQKIASSGLEAKDPAVYAFLSAFSITNEDQLSMLPAAEIDQTPIEEVAAKWIAENEDVWRAWLPAE